MHELLAIAVGLPTRLEGIDGRCRRHAITPRREREKGSVLDELGIAIGIGPMPA